MQKKENAPAAAATATEAVEELCQITTPSTSTDYYSIGRGRIASLLMCGEANKMTTKQLLQLTGLKTPRDLQTEIEQERCAGVPIITSIRDTYGYYLPAEDPAEALVELAEFLHYMDAKAKNTFRSAQAARTLYKLLRQQLEGQLAIEQMEGVCDQA